jgi:hypothetical protein
MKAMSCSDSGGGRRGRRGDVRELLGGRAAATPSTPPTSELPAAKDVFCDTLGRTTES